MNPGVDGDNIYQHRGAHPSVGTCALPGTATSPTAVPVEANFQTDVDRLAALLEDDAT